MARRRELNDKPIIPGLPDDVAYSCLARVSHGNHGLLEVVCKKWKDVFRSSDYSNLKAREGWCGNWLFVLTEGDNTEWIAYDPDADRWHPLPKIPTFNPGWHHDGFSCISVRNRFLVIGGCYTPEPLSPHQKPLITNEVVEFNPFKKEWRRKASMKTPRSNFACCVVGGKVYVAGGRTSSTSRGIDLAEVYDPVEDRWKELPTMPTAQMDCIGLSIKNRLHVLSDQVGLPDHNTSELYDPLDRSWRTVGDIWPFSKAMQVAVTVVRGDRIFTLVDCGESCIKRRDTDQGQWSNVGPVPLVTLTDHTRSLEAFGYGFAALGSDLYVVGGKVLKWEATGRFDIVKLNLVRICDPTVLPLKWRETRPMYGLARGAVVASATLEE
ncbi:hypothetical protein GIB67_001912 [Kingdonia uniflora]|uniref:Uncharacterized protein n=1 Tax=Kingdonia uniflora TaxID=39325 RepID=A0A7J7NVH5_9MAGN|nr:hypothetical protein GIB67_001912 [Kingdonia uniflora]